MQWSKIEELMSRRDELTLAGVDAQRKLAPSMHRPVRPLSNDYRKAGVAAIIFPKNGETHIILIKRAIHPKDKHSGQIGFPGGKYEESDESLFHTALRETREEIGIQLSDTSLISALTTLYVPVSNFMISPYLLFLPSTPKEYILQLEEVSDVLEVPLKHLYYSDIAIGDINNYTNIPHFRFEEKIIWGATAMILNEILQTLA